MLGERKKSTTIGKKRDTANTEHTLAHATRRIDSSNKQRHDDGNAMETIMPKFARGPFTRAIRLPANDKGYVVGENHHRARLSDEDIELAKQLHDAGLSYAAIAKKFDHLERPVSKSTIRDACLGRRRAQVPTQWVLPGRRRRSGA